MNSRGNGSVSDRTILRWVRTSGPATPRDIAEGRRRENVIRVRCRELCTYGLLQAVTHDLYVITDRGTEFLERDVSLAEFESGSSPTPACEHAQWTRTGDRIDDFSQIDAETIKQFNYERYMDSEDSYGLVDGSREKTVRRIWNVQDLCLERVMREFPRRDPVVQQCAHWVRTISGKHFFPDANHRTAIGTLRAILELNDVPIPDRWPGEYIDHTILQAKFVRTFVVDVRFDTLWCRDELYHVWHRHFCTLFHDTDTAQQHDIPTPVLGRAFDAARNELSL